MSKMDSSFQRTNHIRKIIFQIGSVRTGAESNAIVWIVYHFHHSQNILFVNDDSRKTKYAPCRIIRMDCHLDIILVTYRHNLLKEIFQVLKQFFIINIFVHSKKLFYFCHTFRLPARHYSSVHIACDRVEHFLRIQCVYCFLCISQYSGTIRSYSCQFCSCPVKYRHKVITYQMNIFFSKIFKSLNIVCNVLVSVSATCLNIIMDIYTFNTSQFQSCCFNFFFHSTDAFSAPYFARLSIIQCSDNSCNPRNLTNLFQSYCVKFGSVPS